VKKYFKPLIISSTAILTILILAVIFLLYNDHLITYFIIRSVNSHEKYPDQYLTISKTIKIDPETGINDYKGINLGSFKLFVPIDGNIDIEKPNDYGMLVKYGKNRTITISKPKEMGLENYFPFILSLDGRFASKETREKTKRLLDSRPIVASFEIEKKILNTTPDSVTIMSSREEILRAQWCLMNKILWPEVHSIYELEIGQIKGIQQGDPDLGDNRICVHLYFPDNKRSELIFRGWSQDEILGILGKVQYAPHR
jgi:hypothetical protein